MKNSCYKSIILDSKTNNKRLNLSLTQRDEIMASKKEIEQGLFVEQDVFDKEIKGWLKEKILKI